jgi:hypothetical protein
MRRTLAVFLISVACQAPAAVPSPTAAAGSSASPAALATATPLPAAPSATVVPVASTTPAPTPLTGTRIELHDLQVAVARPGAELVNTAVGNSGGVVLTSGPSGTWTSAWREPGFAFTRLIPSWNAETPEGTWLDIEVQTRRASGGETKWWSFGRWAYGDATVKRTSVKGQRDADGNVDTDVLQAAVPMTAYRVRLTLARAATSVQTPTVRLLTVMAAAASAGATIPSPAGVGAGKELSVPPYSQEIHAGEYPEYDGGGEAWCSPTSTSMVMAFWGKSPSSQELEWVDPRFPDPHVDHAARYTYDAAYGGTGNWPFNTAYAGRYGLRAFVTQLRSLSEAERFIAAGIPLVASVRIAPGALPGFLLPGGSNGHLLVISGFTSGGDVISHDPAAMSNATVRRVYPRAAFEQAWLGGSQGTVYVIHPPSTPLPERVPGTTPNW